MGFGIREGIMLGNAFRDIRDQQKGQAFEKQYKTHLSGLQADPENYKPEKDYDPKALNQARLSYTSARMQEQQVQKGVFEHQRESIDAQYNRTVSFIKQAQAANAGKDLDLEFAAYEKAYENTFDGNDMRINKDKKSYTVTDKLTKESTVKTFKDSTAMQQSMKRMADLMGQSEAFAQQALQTRIERSNTNANQDWTPLKNDKGVTAWTTTQFNNDTGEVDAVYEVQGQRISDEDARKMGFMTGKQRKIFAEAEVKEAAAAAAGKKPKGVTVQPHAEKKLALWYSEVYKVPAKEAANMVRKDKAMGRVYEGMKTFRAELMAEPGEETPEEIEKIKAERERLRREYEPTRPSTKKARGLPTEKPGKIPTKRLPDPSKLKEGQTAGKGKYVVKDGKWTIAK